ncbi:MAG: (Na+)-NQR maturation NqrM [Alphaproteobacteria bacterium]
METLILTFVLLIIVVIGMALGVILNGKTIKGSCGGLNAISGGDKCTICQKDIDPNSPLRDKLQCGKAKNSSSNEEDES